MNQQIVTFRQMFPHIKDGGLYMCEDCCTSYWNNYWEGGKVSAVLNRLRSKQEKM